MVRGDAGWVLEAQASGLPVIVTDAGGPAENMIPGKTGLVVKGDCAESPRRTIRELALIRDWKSRSIGDQWRQRE